MEDDELSCLASPSTEVVNGVSEFDMIFECEVECAISTIEFCWEGFGFLASSAVLKYVVRPAKVYICFSQVGWS